MPCFKQIYSETCKCYFPQLISMLHGMNTAFKYRNCRVRVCISNCKISDTMKIIKAIRLRRLRTACSFAHRDKSSETNSEFLSSEVSNSFILTGKITINVKGMTAPKSKPPRSHVIPQLRSHTIMPLKEPKTASEACITAALL
jgi:hypothetical protein